MSEDPKVKLQLKRETTVQEIDGVKKPVDATHASVEIGIGEYRGRFERASEPFAVSQQEAEILLGTDRFEPFKERVPADQQQEN